MNRRDVSVTQPWMGAGTEFFARIVDSLPDDALRGPSALPEWSRGHIVAHLARNAEALIRLATWARTGIETPMYPNRESRAADIESSSHADTDTLRAEFVSTAADLDAALSVLDERTWQSPVRTALGRPIPATEIPWRRIREVWLHAVDLDGGATVADLPPDVVDALLDDAAPLMATRTPEVLRLVATDRERAWAVGDDGPAIDVQGTAADLCGWLLGRSGAEALVARAPSGAAVAAPVPPRWL